MTVTALKRVSMRQMLTAMRAECSVGKYFWKEADPTEFYACVEPTTGVNPQLPDYVINAVKMRCSAGTYMCTRYTDVSGFCCLIYTPRIQIKDLQFSGVPRVSFPFWEI